MVFGSRITFAFYFFFNFLLWNMSVYAYFLVGELIGKIVVNSCSHLLGRRRARRVATQRKRTASVRNSRRVERARLVAVI